MKKFGKLIIIISLLTIILAIVILNNSNGEIEKEDVLSFYSNLLVVFITVMLGIINYEQAKQIQKDGEKENQYLRTLNKEANENNKKLVDIIERNVELEEQKNMPCLSIANKQIEYCEDKKVQLEFKNVGNTIIKYVDIEDIKEDIIVPAIGDILNRGLKSSLKSITDAISKCFSGYTRKTDYLSYFKHNVDVVGINEKFKSNVTVKEIKNEEEEVLNIIALNLNIENIYGKKYNEKIILMLKKDVDEDEKEIFSITHTYIDIQREKK